MGDASVIPSIGPSLSGLSGSLPALPFRPEVDPTVLLVFAMLTGIAIATMSVVLIYHWRRFPFEHEIFRIAERAYLVGVVVLLTVAAFGILIS